MKRLLLSSLALSLSLSAATTSANSDLLKGLKDKLNSSISSGSSSSTANGSQLDLSQITADPVGLRRRILSVAGDFIGCRRLLVDGRRDRTGNLIDFADRRTDPVNRINGVTGGALDFTD